MSQNTENICRQRVSDRRVFCVKKSPIEIHAETILSLQILPPCNHNFEGLSRRPNPLFGFHPPAAVSRRGAKPRITRQSNERNRPRDGLTGLLACSIDVSPIYVPHLIAALTRSPPTNVIAKKIRNEKGVKKRLPKIESVSSPRGIILI